MSREQANSQCRHSPSMGDAPRFLARRQIFPHRRSGCTTHYVGQHNELHAEVGQAALKTAVTYANRLEWDVEILKKEQRCRYARIIDNMIYIGDCEGAEGEGGGDKRHAREERSPND
eukprot:evm.model.NODE_20518_length_48474_cov_83.695778.11